MDIIDAAQRAEEFELKNALQTAKRNTPKIIATGFCLSCEQPVEDGRRWCDAVCRDDWESEQ